MSRDPVFVLGAPRSGTTLLRVMMAGQPRLWSPPEMVIAPFATMAERKAKLTERFWEKGGLRRGLMDLCGVGVDEAKAIEASFDDKTVPEVYAWLRERLGDRILVDKCPHLAADLPAMERLARWFPDARYVWIVRHPGSVTRSVENMPMAEVMLQGYAGVAHGVEASRDRPSDGRIAGAPDTTRTTSSVGRGAADARDIWYACNRNIQRFLASVPKEHQAMVRYEDLVAVGAARASMERICAAIGVPFDERMLDPYEGDRMRDGPPGARPVGDPNMAGRGKIEPELATKWLETFDPASVSPETHALARELGYDLGALAPPPITRATAAFDALLDAARDIERKIRVPSDLDAVEGRRFLLRMVSASLDLFVEHGDADHPAFHHAEGPTRKMFADNPDADYLRSPIDVRDGRAYRVTGRVPPGTVYVGILLYGKGGRVARRLSDRQFVRQDGTFDVQISVQPPADGAAWLQADGDENAVFVRQYYDDRAKEAPVELAIRLEGEAPAPKPLTPDALAKALDKARRNLEASYVRTVEAYKVAVSMALNRFVPIGGEQLFPTPDNKYLVCWYRIGPDQCAIVRGRMPKGRWVGFTLYNAWMESLDYTTSTVTLSGRRMKVADDGTYEIAVSHRDLGFANRLDTTGHLAGYVLVRVLLPDEEELPVPTLDVRWERELP